MIKWASDNCLCDQFGLRNLILAAADIAVADPGQYANQDEADKQPSSQTATAIRRFAGRRETCGHFGKNQWGGKQRALLVETHCDGLCIAKAVHISHLQYVSPIGSPATYDPTVSQNGMIYIPRRKKPEVSANFRRWTPTFYSPVKISIRCYLEICWDLIAQLFWIKRISGIDLDVDTVSHSRPGCFKPSAMQLADRFTGK